MGLTIYWTQLAENKLEDIFNYKIIYWVNTRKQRIEIATIFDCRQNPAKIEEIK